MGSEKEMVLWRRQAARHPAFIGYGLHLLRERFGQTEEEQRQHMGLPLGEAADETWDMFQAMKWPRDGEQFAEDTVKIVTYITKQAAEREQLILLIEQAHVEELLREARNEMTIRVAAQQPFRLTCANLVIESERARQGGEHFAYLPQHTTDVQLALVLPPADAGDAFMMDWVSRILSCADCEQARELLASFALVVVQAGLNRAIDEVADLVGLPRSPNE